MFSKNVYFSAFFLLYCGEAFATVRTIPSEHFFSRYDKASVVVAGRFSETGPSDVAITELGNFPKEKFQKGKFVVEMSWKENLKPGTKLDVYYFPRANLSSVDSPDESLAASSPDRGATIVYLRRFGGKNVMAEKFGITSWDKYFNKNEKIALDLLKGGAPEEEVINALSYSEKHHYLRQLKERGKIDRSE